MPRDIAPDEVVALADARSAARRARDFETADRLRAEIEAAGWRVIDAASLYTLERAVPLDTVVDGVVAYGASESVPSRLDEAPVGTLTVVVEATDDAEALAATVAAVAETAPDGTQLVVVANAPSDEVAARLAALDAADPGRPGVTTEVVRTARRWGRAAALNAGIRRAAAPVVATLTTGVEPGQGLLAAMAAALDDPRVAVAGPVALVTEDFGSFTEAAADTPDVEAIGRAAMAFRRGDYAERGPLDERFEVGEWLDAWWSLVLRDLGEDDDLDAEPRAAIRVEGELRRPDPVPDEAHARAVKKAFYRYLKAFASRRDLLGGEEGEALRARFRALAGDPG